jgi:hypothetical protein
MAKSLLSVRKVDGGAKVVQVFDRAPVRQGVAGEVERFDPERAGFP